ncbi:sigma 54-interacting transcriptional regulator [Hymenobacter daeguensis]
MEALTPSAPAPPFHCQVLIVEDEYVIANNLQLILEQAGYGVIGIADSIAEAHALMAETRPDMVLLDIYLKRKERGLDLAKHLFDEHIPFIYISANDNPSVLEEVKATFPSGYIVKPFRDQDVLMALEIGRYRHAHGVEMALRKEKVLQIAITEALAGSDGWEVKLLQLAQLLQEHIPFDFFSVRHRKADADTYYRYCQVGFQEYQSISPAGFLQMTKRATALPAEETAASDLYNHEAFKALCREHALVQLTAKTFKLNSALLFSLAAGQGETFDISFFSRQPDAYRFEHSVLLDRLEQPILFTLERALAYDKIAQLSEQLRQENAYLQEEVKTSANFEEIIGTSPPLLQVFNQVTQVAPTDTTVLILGESGTGKELFARAIHNLSARKDKMLVKLNCATLPATLIESELFGHERGAFTGATDKRVGKFELANGGTIFLDEIGELPLELQAKLLRVLQEREVERVGSNTPIKVDVRIIVATNRHIEQEVTAGRFRLDLYFRLAIFPILLPPLRDRPSDIPSLASFFAQKSARRMGKPFAGIPEGMLQELLNYSWPGNIRELENVIEQAVIINDGKSPLSLGRPLSNNLFLGSSQAATAEGPTVPGTAPKDLTDVRLMQEETEREYILSILQQTNGRVRGSGGAAERLNLKPTTLEYRMEKLGIRKTIAVKPTASSPGDN